MQETALSWLDLDTGVEKSFFAFEKSNVMHCRRRLCLTMLGRKQHRMFSGSVYGGSVHVFVTLLNLVTDVFVNIAVCFFPTI